MFSIYKDKHSHETWHVKKKKKSTAAKRPILLHGCRGGGVGLARCNKTVKKRDVVRMVVFFSFFFTNSEVLGKEGFPRSNTKAIKKGQMKYLGHINRRRGIERLALSGKLMCRRARWDRTGCLWTTGQQITIYQLCHCIRFKRGVMSER